MVERHFACTQCGRCCNRAPELELGEAAELADVFVLQLLMRIYSLPRSASDHLTPNQPRDQANTEFYQTKRLLSAFAATSWPAKVARDGRAVEYIQYLSLSVLPLDFGTGACNALDGARCSIYEQRPLSCRTVPLHYSRAEAFAARDLDRFISAPGYACATDANAPLVISQGRITDQAMLAGRADALRRAQADRPWKAAIVKAMKARQSGLPSPRGVEAEAARGALTASMLAVWSVAEAAGLITQAQAHRLLAAQCNLIEQDLLRDRLREDVRITLNEMHRDYAVALADR